MISEIELHHYLGNGKSKYNVCHLTNTTDATSGAGTVNPSGAHEFIPGLQWGLCCSIFSVQCFVDCCLSFFYWPLLYLLFSDLRFYIPLLISSSSSFKNQTGFCVSYDFKQISFCYICIYLISRNIMTSYDDLIWPFNDSCYQHTQKSI